MTEFAKLLVSLHKKKQDLQCHHTKILIDSTNYPIDVIELDGSNTTGLVNVCCF